VRHKILYRKACSLPSKEPIFMEEWDVERYKSREKERKKDC
jgi:hypothetical protein